MKGSPGGILLIALGAIFLNVGFTGRYKAVWDALRTGSSDSGNANLGGGTVQGDGSLRCPVGKLPLYHVHSEKGGMCMEPSAVKEVSSPGECTDPNNAYYLREGAGASQKTRYFCPVAAQNTYAGEADFSRYNSVYLPNGAMSLRYAPNAVRL